MKRVFIALLMLMNLRAASAADAVRIVTGGPSTAKKLAPLVADIEKATGTKVEVSTNPVDIALISMQKGVFDAVIGPAEETFAAAEKRSGQKINRDDFQFFSVSTSQMNIGVHPSNPVKELSVEQVTGLLSGKTKTWESINGQKAPVTVLMAKNYLTAMKLLNRFYIKSDESPVAQVVINKDGLLAGLKGNPNAVGFFTSRETAPDFSPKFLPAHVAQSNQMIMRKNARPEAQKVYEYLKAHPLKD